MSLVSMEDRKIRKEAIKELLSRGEISEDRLYDIEASMHKGGSDEHVSPIYVLELIDEIKRFRGLPIEKWPSEFLPDEPIAPVEFDFSEIFNRRD